jgi:hypothetical protein
MAHFNLRPAGEIVMFVMHKQWIRRVVVALLLLPPNVTAQVTRADYDRALGLRERHRSAVMNLPEPAAWIGKTHRFVYRKSVKGGHEFVSVSAQTLQRRPPFDHARLAASFNIAVRRVDNDRSALRRASPKPNGHRGENR